MSSRLSRVEVEWIDATRDEVEEIEHAPILRLAGACQSNCTISITFIVLMAIADPVYYKSCLSIAGIVAYPGDKKNQEFLVETISLTPGDSEVGYTGFLTADVAIHSEGDGVFIDYYLEKTTIYDRWGRPHQYLDDSTASSVYTASSSERVLEYFRR